ncbi:DUF4347 domain-containing protein, partial [Maricaulis sp.]|uniref:DUF4347 domain-containing protein n=2 Tax=Maricaulis sp. TaxID=1486257 RepID=UPI00329A6D09
MFKSLFGSIEAARNCVAGFAILAAACLAPAQAQNEVVFVDPGVTGADVFEHAAGDAEYVRLDAGRPPLEQIAGYMDGRHGIRSVHLISHGAPGALQFSGGRIDRAALDVEIDYLARIRAALADNADVRLYACDVASGAEGASFASAFADALGADMAASTNLTGAGSLGGDWALEWTRGELDRSPVQAGFAASGYAGVLQAIVAREEANFNGIGGTIFYPGLTITDGNYSFEYDTPNTPAEWIGFANGGEGNTGVAVARHNDASPSAGSIRITHTTPGTRFDFVSFWHDIIPGRQIVTVEGFLGGVSQGTYSGGALTGTGTATMGAAFDNVDEVVLTSDAAGIEMQIDSFVFDPPPADSTAPAVQSITVSGTPGANAASIDFVVDFDENANNVSTDDFSLTTTGSAGGTIASVSAASGDPITVTVNSITGTGTIRLDLDGGTNIADDSANSGPAAYSSGSAHTVDRDAPSGYTIGIDQGALNAANDNAASFTFASAEVGADYDYTITSSGGGGSVTGSGTIATATDQITGLDVSGLPDGTLTFSVTLTDAAGNTGGAATDTVAKDATAPAGYTVTLDQDPVTTGNQGAVSFTFAGAEVGADYDYTITSSGGGGSVTSSGTIATATDQISGIDVSGLPDGTLTLSATLTDTAGNAGGAATDTAAKDTAAPAGYSVTLDQDPVNSGNAGAASFTFAGAEVGADYDYTISSSGGAGSVTGSGTIATATDQITGIDVSGLPDGTLTLSVTLTDGGGNTGGAATDTATKETVAPAGYSVALDQDPVTAANANAVSFTFAGAEVGADYDYAITSSGGGGSVTGSGTIATATDQISGIDVSGLNDGTLTLSVTLTDPAGNTGAAATDTASKDALAPAGYSASFDQAAVNAGNADGVSFTFAGAEVGTDYDYTITSSHGGGSVTGSGTIATATDQIGGIDVLSLVDGTLTLSVTLTDSGGNTGVAATDTVSKDVVVPSGYSVSLDQDPVTAANDNAVSFTFAGAEVGVDYDYAITSSGGGGSVTGSGTIATATDQISGIDV